MNIAGFVAANILEGKVRIVHWRELSRLSSEAYCLDVRSPQEFQLGCIPGFVNIPLDDLRGHLEELPKDKTIIVNCAVGLRGYLAARILMQQGFTDVRNLSGGYKTWHGR